MPAIAVEGGISTGHGCFPPTQSIGPFTSTAFLEGKRIQIRGVTQYAAHTCGKTTHPPSNRVVIDPGGSTFFMEGLPVAMIGDMITCGDAVGKGASSTFSV